MPSYRFNFTDYSVLMDFESYQEGNDRPRIKSADIQLITNNGVNPLRCEEFYKDTDQMAWIVDLEEDGSLQIHLEIDSVYGFDFNIYKIDAGQDDFEHNTHSARVMGVGDGGSVNIPHSIKDVE